MKLTESMNEKKTPRAERGHHLESPAEQFSFAEEIPALAAKMQNVSREAKES